MLDDGEEEDGELREHEEHHDLGEGHLPEVPLVAPAQRPEAHDEEEDQPGKQNKVFGKRPEADSLIPKARVQLEFTALKVRD